MTATPAFLTLVSKARRRAVWNLVGEQASVGAACALGCALLLLLLGTEILQWYWPVVLFFGGMAVAAWRTRRSLPSPYTVAQRVDERLNLADVISTVIRQTLRQLITPDALRGRMTSINMIFFMGGPQLGELEAGVVAALIGAPLSVVTGGLGCLIAVALIAWKVPLLRQYDEDDLKRAGEQLANESLVVATGK